MIFCSGGVWVGAGGCGFGDVVCWGVFGLLVAWGGATGTGGVGRGFFLNITYPSAAIVPTATDIKIQAVEFEPVAEVFTDEVIGVNVISGVLVMAPAGTTDSAAAA